MSCALLVSVLALIGGVRLVAPATSGVQGTPPGVDGQLTFLRGALDAGAGERAQRLFPEGHFFAHVLYGLARVEYAARFGTGEPQRIEAVREAGWALEQLDSPVGRAPFNPDLTPAYGVFYVGWTTWLRGGVLALEAPERRDPVQVRRFAEDSAALGAAFDAAGTPYLPAYSGQAWPVDSTVAVAALRLHDTLLPPRYAGTVDRWLDGVRQRLDPRTGLMPHRVDPDTGMPVEVARGTSQSMIHRFLPEVDGDFAREQYLRFRDRFVTTPLRLGPAVREYPEGTSGVGDVDSGPLLLGVSLSATVVTLGAAQVHGDDRLAAALARFGEFAGLPLHTPSTELLDARSTKRYAFGVMPVGDAFLAWSKTARPWVASPPTAPPPPDVPGWWQLPLLAGLLVVGLLPWVPWLVARRRRSRAGGLS